MAERRKRLGDHLAKGDPNVEEMIFFLLEEERYHGDWLSRVGAMLSDGYSFREGKDRKELWYLPLKSTRSNSDQKILGGKGHIQTYTKRLPYDPSW